MKKNFSHALCIVMRASRKSAGLTLRVVADKLEMSTYALEELESGRVMPNMHDREAYADAVGTTEVDLLRRAWQTHDLMSNIKPLRTS